jgi:4'-phosphopantetheinyl transferase EntD
MKHYNDSFADLLFPNCVATVEASPCISRSRLHEDEWKIVATAVPKRQAEFCGGRMCAHQALEKLGIAGGAILQNSDRSPRWPANVTGSISHTEGYCAAAVARRDELEGIGLDVELASPLEETLHSLVCTAQERRWLSAYPLGERNTYAKILFSVKEAAFKCQFPLTRQFIEYCQAEIVLDFEQLSFRVAVPHKRPEVSLVCAKIRGRFEVRNGFIFSGATIVKETYDGR